MADYTPMWHSLGLDVEAHDGLLRVLGDAYKDIYLSQENRPERMDYFDFVISEIHGLRIQELMEARRDGRRVFGSFCLYVPEELILAADGISVGLCAGADVGTEAAEKVLPRNTCALIKSFFGFKLSALCPYIEACDLVVGETTCDGKTKAYELFNDYKSTFVIEVPHMRTSAGRQLWRSEIERLAAKIEHVSGREITADGLRKGVWIVNEKRRALHRLNALRRSNPVPISGRDALLINQIQFYDDPVRFASKVNALCDELDERVQSGVGVAPADALRVLVSGCPMAAPNWKLPFIIEKNGAVIVGEESCVGERGTRHLVDDDGATVAEILDRVAERYLRTDCAVFTPNPERLDHIAEMVRSYGAVGVVHYALQFCAPYTIEAASVERALGHERIPLLKLETDYSAQDVPQLETRVQAFLEILKR
ncbi:MAG: 2-hydroxyacyl-CoA dehydratase [Armatimonadetes bacterium]|nr:2-hydroxyacyl-CoA dehydratase [Armatimonadota bacterium]